MNRPRLIFVNRVYWPSQAATAQLLTDLAEGLAGRGWPVHVIAAGEASGEHHGVTLHRTGPGETHHGLFSRVVNYQRFRRRAQRQLTALVGPGDIVVAMTDPPMLGSALDRIAAGHGARVVHWIQDIYPEIITAHLGAIASIPLWPWRRRRDAAWRSAAGWVALGADMALVVAARGVAADRIAVVPNWAPRELQVPPAPAGVAAKRTTWGLAKKFIVAYSGNLGRVHEFTAVLDAAARLRARPDIVFLFVGHGARFDEVRTAARTRKLENVRFLPPEPRAQLAEALAAADVHLVTLKPEFAPLVFPSKLAGVLAAGRPVLFVGPPMGELSRLVARERCGAAFAPTEGERLAATVTQWQADPALCGELGRRARLAYERGYTLASALTQWDEVLQRVASVPPRRPTPDE